MSGVRVLRLIEYQFVDQETADRNLAGMVHSLEVGNMRMRSSIIQSPLTTEETKTLFEVGNLAVDGEQNNDTQADPDR
jgi:hypothetical protein